MRKLLPILTLVLACGCRENKPFYLIHVGETMDLYLGTNSCCKHCWLDNAQVEHVRFIGEEVIETSDLAGGSGRTAWTFQGLSPGTDTLRIAWVTAGIPCDAQDGVRNQMNTYIVEVIQ